MNTTQLRYFNAVAELENMSKASALLHASQPAISKNIAKLEEELDCKLFIRNGKSIKLNEAGEKLFKASTQMIKLMEGARDEINLSDPGKNKRIRIGLAAGIKDIGKCIKQFGDAHPEADFDMTGSVNHREMLDINDYDAIVYPKTASYEKYTGYEIYRESCFMAINKKNPLSQTAVFNLNEIEQQRLVFMKYDGESEYAHRILDTLSIRPNHSCFTDLRALHKQMIAENAAIGFVPEAYTDLYTDSRISLIPIMDKRFSRTIMVSFRKEKHLSPPAIEFRNFMLSYYGIGLE